MDRVDWMPMPPASDATAARRSRSADLLAALRRDPRQAVEEEHIVCLICAARFRQLTNTHLRSHQLTAAEYKVRFGYNRGRPLMCRALARLYAERAVRNGLADRIRSRRRGTMNCRVLAAGWPFAGLLALEASRVDAIADSAKRSGIIARDDGGRGILVYESEDTYVTVELERTTAVFGVDGYPISLVDLCAGDVVQVIQEQRESRWVTTEVRVLQRSSERSAAAQAMPPLH
jgi:hypothetical protein